MRIVDMIVWFIRNWQQKHPNQIMFTTTLVDSIFDEAREKEARPAAVLFLRLPDEAANIVTRYPFDPYNLHLNRESMRYWLDHHILFSKDGRIAILHDFGKVIWKDPEIELKEIVRD